MQALFYEINSLDQRCYKKFYLSPEILMEHAANSVATYIGKKFLKNMKILIITSSGHNGADGLALARLLCLDYDVNVFEYKKQKSNLGLLQKKRAQAVRVKFVDDLADANIIVDALFGTGLTSILDEQATKVILKINDMSAFKIAIDIPSGILLNGKCSKEIFKADTTITMGALKTALYSDYAKNFIGEIKVANLGVSRKLYEVQTDMFVLDIKDLKLPLRKERNTHKGNFGHACFISGDKEGASIMAGLAANNFGVGLVTLISQEYKHIPFELMQSKNIAKNCTALCLGMGLGVYSSALHEKIINFTKPIVIDADLFYHNKIKDLLNKDLILTPHAKEFCALLKILNIANIDVRTLQEDRLKYVKLFIANYPNIVLILKGANVIIANKDAIYINPHGTTALSKGGSGDILCGLLTALLAQGYEPLNASITASLAHTKASNLVDKNNYAVTPRDLIKRIGNLK